jgi:hypothetical protein
MNTTPSYKKGKRATPSERAEKPQVERDLKVLRSNE